MIGACRACGQVRGVLQRGCCRSCYDGWRRRGFVGAPRSLATIAADWRCQTCGGWEAGHRDKRECNACATYRCRHRQARPARLWAPPPLLRCESAGCPWTGYKRRTRGLCRKHYVRWWRQQRQEQAA